MANWKDIMKQVGEALGLLKSKMSRLESQREAAKLSLQKAMAALQAHLLDGDDSDEKTTGNLQAKVDSGRSLVASLNTAIETQADRVVQAEREMADEQTKKERTAASDVIYADVEHIEKQLAPWLAATRALAKDLRKYASFRTETSAIAEFIANASNEAELALSISIPDLRGGALAVLEGRERAPAKPSAVVKTVAPPIPTTGRVYLTASVAWHDDKGAKFRAPAMNDCDLPLTLIAKGKAIGAVHELNSDVRKKSHGSRAPTVPAWEHCRWLNDDPNAKTGAEPIMSSHFQPHPGVGKPYTIRQQQPVVPVTATRTLPTDK
jgi:chaperonin cofactor prefoldin